MSVARIIATPDASSAGGWPRPYRILATALSLHTRHSFGKVSIHGARALGSWTEVIDSPSPPTFSRHPSQAARTLPATPLRESAAYTGRSICSEELRSRVAGCLPSG